MEFEAYDEGTIAKIVVPEGTDGVKVGAVIAMLAEDGEDAASVAAPGGGDTAEADDEGAKAQPKDEQPAEEAPAAPESPTPHKVETGARKMYDAASHDAEVADPEIPAGPEMVTMTVREALRDALAGETAAKTPALR